MKKFLFVLLACLSTAVLAKGKENLEFQCTLKNGAVVTVHSTKSDYIYRHFTKDKEVDLEIKQNKNVVEENSFKNLIAPLGSTNNLYFKNGRYGYNIFTVLERGSDGLFNGNRDSGIEIYKDGEQVFDDLDCVRVKTTKHLTI